MPPKRTLKKDTKSDTEKKAATRKTISVKVTKIMPPEEQETKRELASGLSTDDFYSWKDKITNKYSAELQELASLSNQKSAGAATMHSGNKPCFAFDSPAFLVMAIHGVPQTIPINLYPIGTTNTDSAYFRHKLHISPLNYPAIRFSGATTIPVDEFRLLKNTKKEIKQWTNSEDLYKQWIEFANVPDNASVRTKIMNALDNTIKTLKESETQFMFDLFLLKLPQNKLNLIVPSSIDGTCYKIDNDNRCIIVDKDQYPYLAISLTNDTSKYNFEYLDEISTLYEYKYITK